MIREIEIGLAIDFSEGLRFFGIEEVNELLAKDYRVISIQEGNAILDRKSKENGEMEVIVSGFSVKIKLELELSNTH